MAGFGGYGKALDVARIDDDPRVMKNLLEGDVRVTVSIERVPPFSDGELDLIASLLRSRGRELASAVKGALTRQRRGPRLI